jgi:flagellar FliL protein
MPEEQEIQEIAEEAPKKKGKGLMMIVLIAVMAAGVGGWSVMHKKAKPADAEPTVKALIHLETFTVNLADTDDRGFLRIGIDLGLNKEPNPKQEAPIAPVRDAVIGVLSAQSSQEMLTVDGKQKLKAQIVSQLQARVPDLGVQEIYFTEFLVQR